MGDNHPPCGDVGCHGGQALGDVLVREPMKPIAAHALGIGVLRDRVVISNGAAPVMKGRIETRNLRQLRKALRDRTDRRQVVGLMQRRQADILLQVREYAGIDQHGTRVFRSAVHDPVTDSHRLHLELLAQPGAGRLQSRRHIWNVVRLEAPVDELRPIGTTPAQAWLRADPVDLASDLKLQISRALDGENLKLHAGRAGVDDEDRVHGASRRRRRRAGPARMRIECRDGA